MEQTIKQLKAEIAIPQGVTVTVHNGVVKAAGKKGESSRDFTSKQVRVESKDGKILINADTNNRNNKKQLKTMAAHIKNMIRGVAEGHTYTLKICSGHFPMTVAVAKDQFSVKNFLGEKIPRTLHIKQGASVKVEGDKVTVESASLEIAGQVSADIENLTKRAGFDTRIFQDGIYIINKDGQDVS